MRGRYPHPSPLGVGGAESPFGVKPQFPELATDLLASLPLVSAPTQGVSLLGLRLALEPCPRACF